MRYLTTLLLLLVMSTGHAETAYVTDLLRLGLHQAEDTSDRAFRTLESGQEMEVLSRTRLYARVRLPDGQEGYVKAAYLVDEKPAKLIVAEERAEQERLRAELESLRASFAQPAETISRLESDVTELETALAASREAASAAETELERIEQRQERYRYSLPYRWVAGAVIACLIGGFLLGLWWFDVRSRRRHGGIRVY